MSERYFSPTPLAYWSQVGSQVVLLDVCASEFLALNKTSSLVWLLLVEGATVEMIVSQLSTTFQIDPGLVHVDTMTFLEGMQARSLLTLADASSSFAEGSTEEFVRWPQVFGGLWWCAWIEAWVTLFSVEQFLRRGSFLALAHKCALLPAQHRVFEGGKQVGQLAGIVKQVAAWQPFKALCLHQYFVLCWMLRRRGVDVELVMGCSLHPFLAHVWIECQGNSVHWETGMGQHASQRCIKDMTVIFRSSAIQGVT